MSVLRPELKNDVNVIGKLKSKFVEFVADDTGGGNDVLRGHFVIETDNDEIVNEIKADFYTSKFTTNGNESRQFKAIQTIDNEYKTIDEYGHELADTVKLYGNINAREYVSNGEYNKFNNVRYVSMTRNLDENDPAKLNELVLEMVVGGYEESDNENDMSMFGYNIGYRGRIIPLFDLAISKDIYNKVKDIYKPGETVTLVCELNNKVTTTVEKIEQDVLFGDTAPEPRIVKEFDREIRVVSGYAPFKDGDEQYIASDVYDGILEERKRTVAGFEAQTGMHNTTAPTDNNPFMDDAPVF